MTLKTAEIIETDSSGYVAECYELYEIPPLGSLVKTVDGEIEIIGVVCHANTAGIDTSRRPVARGKNEETEAAVYDASPHLNKLLRSEFSVVTTGYLRDGAVCHYLPDKPPRIHGFVYCCSLDEIREFSCRFDFLHLLANSQTEVNTEEMIAAALRNMSAAHEKPGDFLVKAGKLLTTIYGRDYQRLRSILKRMKI